MPNGRFPPPLPEPFAWIAISVLSILVALASVASCRASPTGKNSANLSRFVAGIVTRSAGLNYITEQDSEVFAFYRNQPVKELTDTVFLALLRRPPKTPIIQLSWSKFFQLRTQSDPTGRWTQLRDYLEANLTNATLFRMPRDDPYESQYDLYAVGIFDGEIVVGVQMFGVGT